MRTWITHNTSTNGITYTTVVAYYEGRTAVHTALTARWAARIAINEVWKLVKEG